MLFRKIRTDKDQNSRQKGQSLVELAISFTFLLIIFGGIVDLGMMFYTYLSLRDTAQEGAIYGSYDPTNSSQIVSRIKTSQKWPIDATNITNITITCNGSYTCAVNTVNSCPGKKITVQVLYNYQPLLPILGTITGGSPITLNSNVTETILNSQATLSYFANQDPPQACPAP